MTDLNAIRDAIGAIADEAHPPQRIRAVVDVRSRHYHQRRLLLRFAGATATAAVAGVGGIEVYRLTRGGDPGFPHIAGGPGGGWLRAEPRWRPTWLPGDFGLTSIGAVIDGDKAAVASRVWTRPGLVNEKWTPTVAVTTGRSDAYAALPVPPAAARVHVHGVPGELTIYDTGEVLLTWQPPGEPQLAVSTLLADVEQNRTVAMRVATSLQRDRGTIAVGPRPGRLPASVAGQPWIFNLSGVGRTWEEDVIIRTPATEMNVSIGPSVGEGFGKDGAQPVKVQGADAWLQAAGGLLVALPDGVDVWVSPPGPEIDPMSIAEDFDFGPIPDMTWYGSR